ncbi:MAG: amidophosphoribosyltransferase [Verrucomicrobiota bacterium]|nr:amidophosphoribosyltransferase [Verrucomicrobiota bacterium]
MGDPIKHECGIALIRLRKPLQYYEQKYGSVLYGFNKLFLLMEKQHNRGQDGAGIGCVKLDMPLGQAYMFRDRSLETSALNDMFKEQLKTYDKMIRNGVVIPTYAPSVKQHFDYGGEVLMGHLRYGTSGSFTSRSCHPYIRRSNWPTRNLMVAGNFNMTNVAELHQALIRRGQHPIFDTDTQTILEEIGFWLDAEHDRLYHALRDLGMPGDEIPKQIAEKMHLAEVLRLSAKVWDGGYTIAGMIGIGDAFVLRDPQGIRPAYYFENDEIVAFASERVPLLTVFDQDIGSVKEVQPGHAMIVRANGDLQDEVIIEPRKRTSCSFERIYFSRGNDPDIYKERQALGGALRDRILKQIDYDLENAVFSYIPNTAEIAYYGLLRSLREWRRGEVKRAILEAQKTGPLSEELLDNLILKNWPRGEKIAHKDAKLRTFISQEKGRSKLVSHVYDITYGVIHPKDILVVLDDSIVRGTTLRESTLKILSRPNPRKIIVASTAPQIRYPDCYGIDMSELGKFIAFQAAIELLKETGRKDIIAEVYATCCREVKKPKDQQTNCVRAIYDPFTEEDISKRIAQLVYPKDLEWKGPVEIIFQRIEDLHTAIPAHAGDWYFTGNYPTPGGTSICNQAFINFYENRSGRTYE